jgi:hypothetical protein
LARTWTFGDERAALQLHQLLRDHQAEAKGARCSGSLRAFSTAIVHHSGGQQSFVVAQLERHALAICGDLDRVREQAREDLPEASRIQVRPAELTVDGDVELHASGRCVRLQPFERCNR